MYYIYNRPTFIHIANQKENEKVHSTPLITTIVGGLVLAYLFGMLAQRLKISPLVGYLAAGVLAGPFTPGFVADASLAPELAEIGIILLMFGVGLHFSLKDLLAVKNIAIPGAICQIAVATILGLGLASLFDWGLFTGIVFGLSLSTASTVVLLRALEERQLIDSQRGQIAIGWLIVEDLAMVLTLVLLPAAASIINNPEASASSSELLLSLAMTIGKVVAFILIMIFIGRRAIPWLLARTAATGSRELFTLAVLVLALGIAYAAVTLFEASFALGAFFAGMVLNESELSHRAAQDTLPLRDAFAVLFFVSVGMLFDPMVLINHPLGILGVLAIIIVGKSAAAMLLVRLFGHNRRTALTVAVSLAQIGEFAFILAGMGVVLEVLNRQANDLILAGAIVSIMLNPILFTLLDRYLEKTETPQEQQEEETLDEVTQVPVNICGHTIVVGYGRVGSILAEKLHNKGYPVVVIEDTRARFEELAERGFASVMGNAVSPDVLNLARVDCARSLLLTIPNGYEAGEIVAKARALNDHMTIIVRAHYDDERTYIMERGANRVVIGEFEIARAMSSLLVEDQTDHEFGCPVVVNPVTEKHPEEQEEGRSLHEMLRKIPEVTPEPETPADSTPQPSA
ncbi:MAG TPA: Kef family K(+) transporter [Morganella sp. (in: Bacteria)]|nr:Kef family K(+) transporter [Morganella sp. (in: enterobacteria)]